VPATRTSTVINSKFAENPSFETFLVLATLHTVPVGDDVARGTPDCCKDVVAAGDFDGIGAGLPIDAVLFGSGVACEPGDIGDEASGIGEIDGCISVDTAGSFEADGFAVDVFVGGRVCSEDEG
jgi:hypothetical protein